MGEKPSKKKKLINQSELDSYFKFLTIRRNLYFDKRFKNDNSLKYKYSNFLCNHCFGLRGKNVQIYLYYNVKIYINELKEYSLEKISANAN